MDANVEFWVFLAQFKGDISLLVKDKDLQVSSILSESLGRLVKTGEE